MTRWQDILTCAFKNVIVNIKRKKWYVIDFS